METVSAMVRAMLRPPIRARPTPSATSSVIVTAAETILALAIGSKTKGRIGTAADRKSASTSTQ